MSGIVEARARRLSIDGLSLKAGTEEFSGYQEHLALIGQIAIEFSRIELFIAIFCAYLKGQTGPPAEYGNPVDPEAVEKIAGMRARAKHEKYLRDLVGARIKMDPWSPLTSMLKRIDDVAKDRNLLFHTPMHVSEKYPGQLIVTPLVGDDYLLDLSLLREVLDAAIEARRSVQAAHHEARKVLNT
jgi:hypothetical protein